MAKKMIAIQSLDEKVSRNPLFLGSCTNRRRNPPIPNRRVKRVKGSTSLKATFVAMKENPQKTIANSAGQDNVNPSRLICGYFYHKSIKYSHVENNLTFNKIYDYRYFQGFGHSVGGEIGFLLWGWKPD
jgi:hypothetical protein